jgi:hypothetical protein
MDDGENQENKTESHQTLGSKKIQEEFDQNVESLLERISIINEKMIDLNKKLN